MKTTCSLTGALLALCAIVQVLFFVLAWGALLPPGAFMQISAKGISVAQIGALSAPARAACIALGLPALLVLCYGLLRLARLLASVRRGALFERATIGHLRAFAGATLLSTVLAIAEPPLRSVMLRVAFDAPATHWAIGFSSEELMLVLVCTLFFLVTSMLHEGRRLAEDNAGFV